jgi:tyrosinase
LITGSYGNSQEIEMRTRRDVWKLASDPGDQTLHWYSLAVGQMQARMFDDPTSWKFQAAMHGYQASLYPALRPGEHLPKTNIQKKYWDKCQHASWWFPPWHRIFVFLFEKMCRDLIAKAGGPHDWALPYWDYSHPATAVQRKIPAAFRSANSGGKPNPLFALRGPGVNSGGTVGTDTQSENTTCMKSTVFSGVFPNGFGGGPSPVMQFSHYTGSCENGPHNYMHDAIGGPTGWMDNPDAAALDPIFWLHHSNIDRLWVIWTNTSPHTPPPDASWNKQAFSFFDEDSKPKTYKVAEVLQTTGPLCDYVYEDTTNPLGKQPPIKLAASGVRFGKPPSAAVGKKQPKQFAGKAMKKSQLVGASNATGITLGSDHQSVAFEMHAPSPVAGLTAAEGAAEPTAQHVFLALENVTAKENPVHSYEVYVNVPEGDEPGKHPELLAGLIPRFGLVKASQSDSTHGGQGLNLSFDISELVAKFEQAGTWDPTKVRVTFAPHDTQVIEALRREGNPISAIQPVKVGRVGIYVQ